MKLATLSGHAVRLFRGGSRTGATARIMAVRVVALLGNVGSGLLTAAYLGPDGRGIQSALMIMPSILGAVSTMGLHASLIYNIRNDQPNGSSYFGAAMLLCLAASMVACVGGWIAMPYFLSQYDPETIRLARILMFCVLFTNCSPLMTAVLEAHGRFGIANRVLYVQSLGTLLLLLLLAWSGLMTAHITAIAYIAPCIPAYAYVWWQAGRLLRARFSLAAPFPRRLFGFGLRFYGVDILSGLSSYVDQAVIVLFLQPAAVGTYAVALSLSRVMSVAQGAVQTVLFPTIAGRDTASVVETVGRVTRVTLVVNTLGAVAIGLAGPSLLLLLYGTRFAAAVTPFLILLVEAVVTSAARTLAQAFSGSGRPGAVTSVEVAGVAASVATMVVLVPVLGINGAACASLLGGCVRLACVVGSFNNVLGIRLPRMLISRADVAQVIGV